MAQQNRQFDFDDSWELNEPFLLFDRIIEDRGSKYSVSVGRVENTEEIKKFLVQLKRHKKYAQATHHSYAARLKEDGAVWETKNDDGETGAGQVILRAMQKADVSNTVVCVTRWFGGVKLMGDRFRHVQDAATYALAQARRDL